MTDSDGYLSKNRAHINCGQRSRRARNPRIDYYPSREALAVINAKRGPYLPWNNNSGILDRIVTEWADLTGIKYREVESPKTSAGSPELIHRFARVNDFGQASQPRPTILGAPSGIFTHIAQVRAREQASTSPSGSRLQVVCGARTRTGAPCRSKSLPGKRRCKWHGGHSTGPKTEAGKSRAMQNLRRGPLRGAAAQTS